MPDPVLTLPPPDRSSGFPEPRLWPAMFIVVFAFGRVPTEPSANDNVALLPMLKLFTLMVVSVMAGGDELARPAMITSVFDATDTFPSVRVFVPPTAADRGVRVSLLPDTGHPQPVPASAAVHG